MTHPAGGLLKWAPRITLLAAAWLVGGCDSGDGSGTGSASAGSGDASRGERLLAQYHCGSCHTIPGVAAARGRVAVTLESFGPRSYIAGRIPNTPELLVQWLQDPASLVPGTTMPDMGVSGGDAKDMAAYLGTLD
jgi:cytochrome c